ncbi:MAG: WYL domain-containing protein [Cyanobacteria bacterium P01_F01_bin.150]
MSRKGKSITLSVSERDKAELETLALEFGMTWGDRPNISKLVEAIARKRLTIASNHDWSEQRITSLNKARNSLIDAGQIDDAVAIAHLLLERSELTLPVRQDLEQFVAKPAPAWRLEVERHIKKQQPFQLTYQDATERTWQFTIRHAEIAPHGTRQYLDCWCEETTGNQDLPELTHNWCLRLDRIADAAIMSIGGKWRDRLDTIDVEIHLHGRLAFAYESKTTKDVVNRWLPDAPQTRQVVRRVSNTFWLIRELLPYGQYCEVISPGSVKVKIADEIRLMAKRYEA